MTISTNGGSSGAYAFDGNSLRVQKTVSGATTVYIFSGTKVIAEYASGAAPSSPSKEYIYAGSQLLATLTGSTTNYHMGDHLSPRLTTDSTGNIVGQQAHFSFGEDWYASGTTTNFKFTSYERDSESGNDYAMLRSSVNRLGRFSSPDPLAGSIVNPQSLNRFAYVLNNPVNLIDPLGLDCVDTVNADGSISTTCTVSAGGLDIFGGILSGGSRIIHPNPDGKGARGGNTSGFFSRLGNRLACAAKFGDEHSLAAATGTQNSFLGKAFLGNTFSSLTQLGLLAAGGPSGATATDVGIAVLSGTHQGLPGGGNIGKGPLGVAQDAIVGPVAAAAYNTAVGAGTQTLELGISSSQVATNIAGVTAETAASAVALAKLGIDALTFGYGLYKCH